GRLAVVVRFGIVAVEQVRPDALDPCRVDAGDGAGVQLGRLGQLGRHHPRRPAAELAGPGEQVELAAAGPGVLEVVGLLPEVPEQPGHQCAVDGGVPLAVDPAVGDGGGDGLGVGHRDKAVYHGDTEALKA